MGMGELRTWGYLWAPDQRAAYLLKPRVGHEGYHILGTTKIYYNGKLKHESLY